MRKNYFRCFAVMITLMMVVTLLSGCNGSDDEQETTTTMSTSIDISEKVKLTSYTMGDAPTDLQMINDAVNKLAEELNCTVDFKMIPWADYATKYNLILTSGQECDLIYTADWLDYKGNAQKGAFLELDELLPRYAPELYDYIPQRMWDGCRVNGKISTVPTPWEIYVPEGMSWREDLRKKYNVPEIDSYEDMGAYLAAIKKNEPEMLPTNEMLLTDTLGAARFYMADFMYLFREGHHSINPWYNVYGLDMTRENPREFINMWESDEYKAVLETMKKWADAGYWPRGVLSNKDDPWQSFQSGKSAAVFGGMNPGRYSETKLLISKSHPDWEIGFLAHFEVSGAADPYPPTGNATAVTKVSKNPDRALMLLEKILMDKRYNHLTQYGIEGTHYKVTDDGYYEAIGDPSTSGFRKEALSGWGWYSPELNLYDKSFDEVLELYEKWDEIKVPNIWSMFTEDYTSYQSERAALAQVCTQYLTPIQAGLVDDIDAAMEEFLEKAKEAGLEKIQEEFKKQWLEFCDEQGLN